MPRSAVRTPTQIERILREDINEAVRAELAKAVLRAYKDAESGCSTLRKATRRDTVAHLRRGVMETLFGAVIEAAGGGVEDAANGADTANHVRGKLNRCVITQHAVNGVDELPRDADFRSTMARSAQTDLFEEPAEVDASARLYCQVLYGPRGSSAPSFVVLAVPDEDCSTIVARVSLTEYLTAARLTAALPVNDVLVAPEERVVDEVEVRLKARSPQPTSDRNIESTPLEFAVRLRADCEVRPTDNGELESELQELTEQLPALASARATYDGDLESEPRAETEHIRPVQLSLFSNALSPSAGQEGKG